MHSELSRTWLAVAEACLALSPVIAVVHAALLWVDAVPAIIVQQCTAAFGQLGVSQLGGAVSPGHVLRAVTPG